MSFNWWTHGLVFTFHILFNWFIFCFPFSSSRQHIHNPPSSIFPTITTLKGDLSGECVIGPKSPSELPWLKVNLNLDLSQFLSNLLTSNTILAWKVIAIRVWRLVKITSYFKSYDVTSWIIQFWVSDLRFPHMDPGGLRKHYFYYQSFDII